MKQHAHTGRWLIALWALLFPLVAYAASERGTSETLHLQAGTDVPLTVFPAQGRTLLIWLPSESGIVAADHKAAAVLAKSGIEVWLPDMHAAYFLPIVRSSMQQIPVADVAQVIAQAQQRGKSVYLISSGNGAGLALQAVAQLGNGKSKVRGAILFSPNLFTGTPEPGEDAKYLPVTSRTRLPIFIVQPDQSPWKWRVEELKSRLQLGGSSVKIQALPGIRDRFYYRGDASATEQAWTPRVPELILNALKSLKEKR